MTNRFHRLLVMSLFLSLSACSAVYASDPSSELDAIRLAIAQKKAGWQAAETPLMRLTSEQRKNLCKAILPQTPLRNTGCRIALQPREDIQQRDQLDWRDHQGFNWITQIRNQGGCGSCAAFAAVGAFEVVIRIALGDPGYEVDLSEQHLFSCSGGVCSEGLYIGDALDYAVLYGIPDEACFPYTASDDNCIETCDDWKDRATRVDSWEFVTLHQPQTDAIKEAVMDGPVTSYMEVYQDFFSYHSGVYEYVWGNYAGGHFVDIIGWDDALDCWICKNSWDKTWGEEGFFRILRGTTMIGSYVAHLTYTPESTPTPATTCTQAPTASETITPTETATPSPGPSMSPATFTPVPWTQTPGPENSPTPASTSTSPHSPPSATPAHPPSPTPPVDGIECRLNLDEFSPGDSFELSVTMCNTGPFNRVSRVYIVLDLKNGFFFWPDWSVAEDYDFRAVPKRDCTDPEVILSFIWPDGCGEGQDAWFWAVLVDPVTLQMQGEHSICPFSYHE